MPKNNRLNSTDCFIVKIPYKKEFKEMAVSHLSDTEFKGFMNFSKKCTGKPYSFLVNDTNFASNNPFCFRRNLLEKIQKLIMNKS